MTSKGQKTAEAILEATCECIAEIGIERTSITAIAERAGVSRALVAHYFPKKAEIFKHVITHIMKQGYSRIEQHSDAAGLGPRELLCRMVDENLRFFLDHPAYFKCYFLFFYFASIDASYRKMNSLANKRAIARIDGYLRAMCAEKGIAVTEERLAELGESIHRELIGAIQKFYNVTHSIPKSRFRETHLAQLDSRLGEFLRPRAP